MARDFLSTITDSDNTLILVKNRLDMNIGNTNFVCIYFTHVSNPDSILSLFIQVGLTNIEKLMKINYLVNPSNTLGLVFD